MSALSDHLSDANIDALARLWRIVEANRARRAAEQAESEVS